MRRTIFFLLFFAVTAGMAQTKEPLVAGSTDYVYSAILKENRKLMVYSPSYDTNGVFVRQRYPVIYLLDGDTHFYTVTAMMQQLTERFGGVMFPQMIVVGILNTDRNRDLTPTRPASDPRMSSEALKRTGGGEAFLSFIEKELIPHIDSLYPTAPYRVLLGHSLGGLTVMNALVHHTKLFNAYIASDPSMSWDNGKLLKQSETILKEPEFAGASLFLAVANTMDKGMDTIRVKKDTAAMSLHIRSILKLGRYLNYYKQNRLRKKWKYYPEYDHSTVPLIAAYDGLQFIFSVYNFNLPIPQFFEPSYTQDSLISIHYNEVSRQMGYEVLPPEMFINSLGYNMLSLKQYDRACRFFELNIKNYSSSFNAYDSMGDYYNDRGDQQKAIDYYSKALSLRDFPDTRKKLEKLKTH